SSARCSSPASVTRTRLRSSSGLSRSCSPRRTSSAGSSSPTECWRCSSGANRRSRRTMGRDATNLAYLVTIVTFILALRFLSNPATARRGNQIGAVGMLVAVAVTFANSKVVSYWEIAVGMVVGGAFGALAARRVKMTAMPQMVALFNGVGGGAAALIALAELHKILPNPGRPKLDIGVAIVLFGLIGAISFAGSMVAFAKLQELIE